MGSTPLPPLAHLHVKAEQALIEHVDHACRQFNLSRSGFCKVAVARLLDDLHQGKITDDLMARLAIVFGAAARQRRSNENDGVQYD